MEEQVILVNTENQPIGTMGKTDAHVKGMLHRAFSVFVFNSKGELLLQQRAAHKYHSGGLWTNTCCSHPRPGEETLAAAHRRLVEEMGFDCELREAFSFTYRSELDNAIIEHEIDHVFIGKHDGAPSINSEEVADWKYSSMELIKTEIKEQPEKYTTWFRICMKKIEENLPKSGK